MALKVKLVRSQAGRPRGHRDTVRGLGLNKLGSEKILEDTRAIRGMIATVAHLVSVEEVAGDPPARRRRKRTSAANAKET